MKPSIAILLLFVLSVKASAQNDSLKKIYSTHAIIAALDSMSNSLMNEHTTDIMKFALFSYTAKRGALIWKDKKRNKGLKICFRNGKLNKKKIASNTLRNIFGSAKLSDQCEMSRKLQGNNKENVSHDFVMYLRLKSQDRNEIYFTYSTYLGNRDSCTEVLKYLISL